MGIIKDWRPLNEVPDATYYTTIGDDRFTTIHWDLKEALSAVSDAFAAFHDGEIEDVCDIELGILVPIARGDDGPEGPTLAHEAASLTTAAHARIVELETEQGELHRELARLRGQLATAREGSEAIALRAEVVALNTDRQWRKMECAPRDGSAIFAMHETGRFYQVTYQQRVGGGVWEDLDGLCRDTDDFLCWLPIPEIVGATV